MANEKKSENKKTEKKQLRVIVEPHLSAVIKRANEIGVTDKELKYIDSMPSGYVLVYYR